MPFQKGHTINLGRKHTEEWNRKISQTHKGENHYRWKGGNITKICKVCGSVFYTKIGLKNIRKHCSYKCAGIARRGKPTWNKGKRCPQLGYYRKGKKLSILTCQKMSKSRQDEKHPQWKGDNVGYGALHEWIKKYKGKPEKCSKCGVKGRKIGRSWLIHWANINHKYRRNLDDFIALCPSCHKIYDLKNKLVNH